MYAHNSLASTVCCQEENNYLKFLSCITMCAFFLKKSTSFVWAGLIVQIINPFNSNPCACSHRKPTLMAIFGTAAPKKPLNRNNGLRVSGQRCQSQGHVPNISQQPLHLPPPQCPIPNPLKVSCRQKKKKKKKKKELQSKGRGGTESESCCVNQLNAIKIYLGLTRNPFTGE